MTLSSHASRWLIVAILGPLLVWIIMAGPPFAFGLVVLAFGLAAWWEFSIICFGHGRLAVVLLGMVGLLLVMLGAWTQSRTAHMAALVAAAALGFLYFLLNYEKITSIIDQVARFALGQVYVSFFFSFLLLLFALDQGRRWVLFTLLVTFLGDTAAFYIGRSFGRRPLYQAVSPKKTREGLWGGVVGGGLTAAVSAELMLPATWYEAGAFGLFLVLWGAAGDLFESMLKRSVGIKDSGGILLGHGGVLDRIDALLFNAPLVYFFALVYGG